MLRLKAQFKNASRKSKKLDGADMVEGGVFILAEQEAVESLDGIETVTTRNAKKW